ncbi:MAG: hypothetical protein ABR992_08670 [Solirubrobacteraceae bacterium]
MLFALSATLVSGAVGQAGARTPSAPRAHASSAYITGIGDETASMFANPLYRQLHTKIVRYIAPYDAAVRPYSLDKAITFIHNAEVAHEKLLVAFYHSEYTPTRMPSVSTYQNDVKKFVKLFPRVKEYESWDESNRGNEPGQFSSPSAVGAAKYYQALLRVCTGCTVIGLDVLDQNYIGPTLNYISEFKHEIYRLETVMPKIWGLHNYSDVNRLEGWRTRELVRALGGQVWLTETGGIVKFGGAFPNRNGSGLTRAAKVLKFMFALAGAHSQIKRLYIYDWNGGNSSTRFDAGLTNAHEQPRQGYVVVCRQLHAGNCGVRIASN